MPLEYENETPSEYVARVLALIGIDESKAVQPEYSSQMEEIKKLIIEIDNLPDDPLKETITTEEVLSKLSNFLPSKDQLQEFTSKVKASVPTSGFKSGFADSHNKNVYIAPQSKTRFQIGPLTYGSEVQSIKILENKAISVSSGVRTTSDFIIDGGTGDADAQVTLLFSGEKHMNEALRPLVALFRLSPVTSVKNNTIKAALYNRFTENNVEPLDRALIRDKVLDITRSEVEARTKELLEKVNKAFYDSSLTLTSTLNERAFDYAVEKGIVSSDITYEAFSNEYNVDFQQRLATAHLDSKPVGTIENSAPSANIDLTGFVPMAMVGMEFSTHPELPEALICSLMLKRVNVGNYLKDFLQYRDFNNLPVSDPKKAFWLNRAIDIYIDRFIRDDYFYNFKEVFGKVNLKYEGEDLYLKRFAADEKLKQLDLNNSKDTFVTQLTYGLYHKFHFCRLIGESYPTVQHMGTSSGVLRLSVTTPKIEQFENIHTYKSAADFFVRNSEKITRFKGWTVDTYLTRLLNFSANKAKVNSKEDGVFDSGIPLEDAFYPSEVISSTNDELPGVHDVAMTFQQTNPDFFDDFGFTIEKGDHSIANLWKFYLSIYDISSDTRGNLFSDVNFILDHNGNLSDPGKRNWLYAYNLMFGSGDARENMMLFNPNTIMGVFLEPEVYNPDSSKFKYTKAGEGENTTKKFINKLNGNDLISGTLEAGEQVPWEVFLTQAKSAWSGFFDIDIGHELATEIFDLYFEDTSASKNARDECIKLIRYIVQDDSREKLYRKFLNTEELSFKELFRDKLFSTMLLRRNHKSLSAVFDQSGVIKAYYALTIGYESKGDEFFPVQDASTAVKEKTSETKIVIDSDGKLNLSDTVTTAYNDYMYLTYDELFTLEDIPGLTNPTRWTDFGIKYKHVGALNNDLSFFGDEDTWKSSALVNANEQLIDVANSPVPPDVFFYREDELADMHVDMDETYSQWFNRLGSLILDLPFDIESDLRDEQGISTGDTLSQGTNKRQLSRLIEDAFESNKKKTSSSEKWKDMAVDVLGLEMQSLIDSGEWSMEDIKKASKEGGDLYKDLKEQLTKFTSSSKEGLVVPFLMGSGLKSPLARYEKLTGVAGAGIARVVTQVDDDNMFKTYIAETITKSAGGALTDMSVTGVNLEENKASMMKILQATPDIGNTMAKAFPVMRLYLIEERGPNLIIQDNFYGYHAIDSIDITLDKNDSSLAVIRLADPFRILQGSEFGTLNKSNDLKNKVALPTDGNLDENFQSKVKLRQGRHIQIRGGYSSSPEHLDILFTGRIAELQFGDMVTVVAQGWKSEIAGKQVNFELHATEDNSVKDLVVRTISDAKPKGIGEYFSGREFDKIANVVGDLSGGEQVMRSRINTIGTSGIGATAEIAGFKLASNIGAGADLRLKNIWVPDTNQLRWNPFKDAIKNGWQGTRWVVPLGSAWDVLQTATNYVWGYICQVVPFDSEGTLFFGKPENLYYYTTGDKRTARAVSKQKVITNDVVKNDILPAIIEHARYNEIFDRYTANAIEAESDGFIFKTILAAESLLTDVEGNPNSETKEKILNAQYSTYFRSLGETFNNELLVARLLLSSFFGLSVRYVTDNIYDPISLVNTLLSKQRDSDEGIINATFDNGLTQNDLETYNDNFKSVIEKSTKKITIEELQDALEVLDSETSEQHLKIAESGSFAQVASSVSDELAKAVDYLPYLNKGYLYVTKMNNSIPSSILKGLAMYGNIGDITKASDVPEWVKDAHSSENPITSQKIVSDARDTYLLAIQEHLSITRNREFIVTRFFDEDFVKISNSIYFDTVKRIEDENDIGTVAFDLRFIFKAYVRSLSEWIDSNTLNPAVSKALQNSKDLFSFNPALISNMKVFRDYHYIKNGRDILSNDLAATTREMHNTVVVKFPQELNTSNDLFFNIEGIKGNSSDTEIESSTTWTTWPKSEDGHIGMQFDDSVTLEDKKIGVYTDLNITRTEQAAVAATNVLTKMMRPMYRNSITVLGRVVKPWDYIYLDDKYTDMKGMLDVERVVHHYSVSTGWTTKIVPHAICEANPGNRQIQAAVMQSKFDTIYNYSETALDLFVLATLIPTLGQSIAVGSAIKAASFAGKKSAFGVLKAVMFDQGVKTSSRAAMSAAMHNIPQSLSRYMYTEAFLYAGDAAMNMWNTSMRSGDVTLPVVLSPITYKGAPLQAGLHGMDETYWSLGSKVYWTLREMNEAMESFFEAINLSDKGVRSEYESIINASTL